LLLLLLPLCCRLPLGPGRVNLLYLVDSTLKLTVRTNMLLLLLLRFFLQAAAWSWARQPAVPGRLHLEASQQSASQPAEPTRECRFGN
jgi:hypothetical protein